MNDNRIYYNRYPSLVLTILIILFIFITACSVSSDNANKPSAVEHKLPIIRYLTAHDMTA